MKQHIFGFVLFTLIVGTAGLISAFFTELPSRDAVKVFEVPRTVEYKSSCWKQVKSSPEKAEGISARVVQAALNQKTKQLETNLFIEREESSVKSVIVSLHFFTKDAKGTRYLATHIAFLEPSFSRDNIATESITSSYKWLNDLDPNENLYVTAETKGIKRNFSDSDAVPVLKSF